MRPMSVTVRKMTLVVRVVSAGAWIGICRVRSTVVR